MYTQSRKILIKFFIVFLLVFQLCIQTASAFEIDLKNGSTLIINSYQLPSQVFSDVIIRLYEDNIREQECRRKYPRHLYCPYTKLNLYEFWKAYYALSEEEKEKIYLPLLKQNPKYFTAYQEFLKKREKGVYAEIYDKETNTLINTSKRNYQEAVSDSTILDDGQVLLIYNTFYNGFYYFSASKLEAYNPLTNKFTIIPNKEKIHIHSFIKLKDNKFLVYYKADINDKKHLGILNIETMKLETADISNGCKLVRPILLSDNKLFFVSYTDKEIIIYNPDTNTYCKTGRYLPENTFNIGFLQTDDDIIYLILNKDNIPVKNVFKYDYNSNELVKIGELRGRRLSFSNVHLFLLKDGNIYIQGGYKKCYFDGSCKDAEDEIFNIKTGKSHYVKNNEKIPGIIRTKTYHPSFTYLHLHI